MAEYLTSHYESFWSPSESMFPTLLVGDFFWVDIRAYSAAPPTRGDVVIFRAGTQRGRKCPLDRCSGPAEEEGYVARIAGVPGDRIHSEGGVLHVNGRPMRIDAGSEEVRTLDGTVTTVWHEQSGDASYRIAVHPSLPIGDFPPKRVEHGRYFMMGDYRNNAFDSRYIGTIAAEHIVGRPTYIYFSKEPDGPVRWSRIGALVR